MTLKERTTKVIELLNEGIHEREETIAVSFLAALSDQSVFLFGPPGTAKSLIARRISRAFETNSYFEYLMHRFSTPEDVFGPISITELKKDNLLRRTEGFLPQSDFAFLDEIWKSSPSILNTLLTIINEKVFRNGTEVEKAPLKTLIAASNESPPPKEGLEAMYDRFLVRLYITSIENRDRFEDLLNSKPALPEVQMPDNLVVRHDEWENWSVLIHEVTLSKEAQNVIQDIRKAFEEKGEKLDVYVSDRRWQRAAILLKAAAFFCGRDEVNLVDCLLLRHCLWTKKKNYKKVLAIVENAVRNQGFATEFSIDQVSKWKEELEENIRREICHNADVYKTISIDNKQFFICQRQVPNRVPTISNSNRHKQVTFFIPADMMNENKEFYPIDENRREIPDIRCRFDSQDSFEIETKMDNYSSNWEKLDPFKPKVLFPKGSRKSGVDPKQVKALSDAIEQLAWEIDTIIEDIQVKSTKFKNELESPFVPEKTAMIAWKGVETQLQEMKLRRKECEHLKHKTTA